MPDKDSLDALRQELERRLQAARHAEGCWRGRLSSSALANALACIALRDAPSDADSRVAVERGIGWLCDHRNADGGWGDTPNSPSNLTTTLLCRAALRHCGVRRNSRVADSARASAAWTAAVCGAAEGSALAPFVRKQYGRDRTFAAPILAICAHTGLLGENGWRVVPSLPYALALAPAPLYRFLHLSVVSYALPALIAVGLMIDCGRCHRGSTLRAALRRKIAPRLVKKLTAMQPSSGGFLEAIPLTAFVAIGLTAAGHGASLAVAACTDFLRTGQRQDGSWPIDTDLATWLTAEAVKALPANDEIDADEHNQTVAWLLDQQFNAPHPFTRAAPGGWGWTDHPGAVPDADDTAGVLLALHRLAPDAPEANAAAKRGIEWLLNLQNRDGGIPTFCRGWGRLPFDRSCPDITAHAAAAVAQWLPRQNNLVRNRAARFLRRSLAYLRKTQAANGSWTPLWFGNQAEPNHANPVFGTARVLCALAVPATQSLLQTPHSRRGTEAALDFLEAARHPDGGWGGGAAAPASIEETAVATTALLAWGRADAAAPGLDWLRAAWTAHSLSSTENAAVDGAAQCGNGPPISLDAAPIGLYFQSLWYSESLYPLLFSAQALRATIQIPNKRLQ